MCIKYARVRTSSGYFQLRREAIRSCAHVDPGTRNYIIFYRRAPHLLDIGDFHVIRVFIPLFKSDVRNILLSSFMIDRHNGFVMPEQYDDYFFFENSIVTILCSYFD